tara:strand:+ start:3789 stop:4196 length:408 start_codon:yes stop_codon:yes gene_type:complete
MGRKFIKIFEKPYLIFWGQFILINIIGFLGDEKVSIINIDSSYFVLVSFDVAILLSKIYVVIGIVYFLTSISKVILNERLTQIHTLITSISGIIFLLLLILTESNISLILILLLFCFVQFILITNILIGLIKKLR